MANPLITNIYPTSGATGISTADVVIVTFDQPLDPETVSALTVILADADTYTAVPCTVTYNSTNYAARLAPAAYLTASTEYVVTIVGRDTSTRYGTAIESALGSRLETTYSWSFTTGTGVTSSTISPDIIASSVQTTTTTTTTPVDYIRLVASDPTNYDTNVPTAINYLILSFNYTPNIENGYIDGDIYGISQTSSRQEKFEYFIDITGRHMLYAQAGYNTNAPGWGYAQTSKNIIVYPSGELLRNYEYTVRLRKGLPGLSSWALATDETIMFTTEMDPLFTTTDVIRLNPIGPLIQSIPDDTLNRMIYEHSIEASGLYPGGLGAESAIPTCVHEYVTCATKLDALQAALANIINGAGGATTKVLGDMKISYDLATASRAIRDLMDPLQKCKDKNKELIPNGCNRNTMKVTVKSQTDPRRPISDSSWRRIPNNLFGGMRDDRPSGPTRLGF